MNIPQRHHLSSTATIPFRRFRQAMSYHRALPYPQSVQEVLTLPHATYLFYIHKPIYHDWYRNKSYPLIQLYNVWNLMPMRKVPLEKHQMVFSLRFSDPSDVVNYHVNSSRYCFDYQQRSYDNKTHLLLFEI